MAPSCPAPANWVGSRKQLDPFAGHAVVEVGKAGGIATRPRQAGDESQRDGIDYPHEHDRDGAARLQQRRYCSAPAGEHDIGPQADQFHRIGAQPFAIGRAEAIVEADIGAIDPPLILQRLSKHRQAGVLRFRDRAADKHSNSPQPVSLLSACGTWLRNRCAEKKRYELAPLHVALPGAQGPRCRIANFQGWVRGLWGHLIPDIAGRSATNLPGPFFSTRLANFRFAIEPTPASP